MKRIGPFRFVIRPVCKPIGWQFHTASATRYPRKVAQHFPPAIAFLPALAMESRFESLRAAHSAAIGDLSIPSLPRRLGPWLLERVVGKGAMATVYQARPIAGAQSEALYAVKVLDAEWQNDPSAVSFFRREAEIGRRVASPHLVSVLSAQVASTPRHFVMPLFTGRTIEERIRCGEFFSLPHALWIARQSAEALDKLHAAGYLHGDIKPGNVMVSRDGHATLLDLGLREIEEAGSALDRPVVGTIEYLAPELLTSTMGADERSDLYSLGATLYEMLAGQPPFRAASLEELAAMQQSGGPPIFGRLCRRCRRRLPTWFGGCWRKSHSGGRGSQWKSFNKSWRLRSTRWPSASQHDTVKVGDIEAVTADNDYINRRLYRPDTSIECILIAAIKG